MPKTEEEKPERRFPATPPDGPNTRAHAIVVTFELHQPDFPSRTPLPARLEEGKKRARAARDQFIEWLDETNLADNVQALQTNGMPLGLITIYSENASLQEELNGAPNVIATFEGNAQALLGGMEYAHDFYEDQNPER